MPQKRILCLGDAGVDIVVPYGDAMRAAARIGQAFEPAALFLCGSTSGNVARGLAKLGASPDYIAKIGDDALGRFFVEQMARLGVRTDPLVVDPLHESFRTIAVIGLDGDRTIFRCGDIEQNASRFLRRDEVDPELLDGCDILAVSGTVLGFSPLEETVLWAMRRCRARGARVVLDLNLRIGSPEFPPGFAAQVDAFVDASDDVLGSIADEFLPLCGQSDMMIAGRTLAARGKTVVARSGGGSVQVFTPEGRFSVPTIPAKVIDALGAGDFFDSGFIAARAEGLDLSTCVQWGNAAANYSIQLTGAEKSGPTRRELLAIVAANYGR